MSDGEHMSDAEQDGGKPKRQSKDKLTRLIKSMSERGPDAISGEYNAEAAEHVHWLKNRGETPLMKLLNLVKLRSSMRWTEDGQPPRWSVDEDGKADTIELLATLLRVEKDGVLCQWSPQHARNTLSDAITEGLLCRGPNGEIGLRTDTPHARKQRTCGDVSPVQGKTSPYLRPSVLEAQAPEIRERMLAEAPAIHRKRIQRFAAGVAQLREALISDEYTAIQALGAILPARKASEAAIAAAKVLQLSISFARQDSDADAAKAAERELADLRAAVGVLSPVQEPEPNPEQGSAVPPAPPVHAFVQAKNDAPSLLCSSFPEQTTNTKATEIEKGSSSQSVSEVVEPHTSAGLPSVAPISENPSDESRIATELPNAEQIPGPGEPEPGAGRLANLKRMLVATGVPKMLGETMDTGFLVRTAKAMGGGRGYPGEVDTLAELEIEIGKRKWDRRRDTLGLIPTSLAPIVRRRWWEALQHDKALAKQLAAQRAQSEHNAAALQREDAERIARDRHLLAHPGECPTCHGSGRYKWEGKKILCDCPAGAAIATPPKAAIVRTREPACTECGGKGVRWDGHRYVPCNCQAQDCQTQEAGT